MTAVLWMGLFSSNSRQAMKASIFLKIHLKRLATSALVYIEIWIEETKRSLILY